MGQKAGGFIFVVFLVVLSVGVGTAQLSCQGGWMCCAPAWVVSGLVHGPLPRA